MFGLSCFDVFHICQQMHSFLNKNTVSPVQTEYSYLSVDFRQKMFLCMNIFRLSVAYDNSVPS